MSGNPVQAFLLVAIHDPRRVDCRLEVARVFSAPDFASGHKSGLAVFEFHQATIERSEKIRLTIFPSQETHSSSLKTDGFGRSHMQQFSDRYFQVFS